MLLKLARWSVYAALITPIWVNRNLFFPFVTSKQIYFRFCIEVGVCFLLMYLILTIFGRDEAKRSEVLNALKHHLRHPVILGLIAFGVIMVISSLVSPNPAISFWSNFERGDGSFQILHYVLFAILIKILFTTPREIKHLFIAQILVSLPVSLYAIGQMLTDGSGPSFFIAAADRVSGTLGNPSYLACYLIFNLACIVYLLIQTKDLLAKIGLYAMAFLSFFLIIKAQTMGGALGVFIGLVVFALHLALTTPHKKTRTIGLAVGGCAIVFAIFFFTTRSSVLWQNVPLFKRLTNLEAAYQGFVPRTWAWKSTLEGVKDRPLLGWGLENFPYAFDAHYNPLHYGRESFFDRSHNVFLEYLSGGGMIGFTAWLYIFYAYFAALKKRKHSFWKSLLVGVPIMYLVQGFFLFDVIAIYITLLLFMMAALNTNQETGAPGLPETTIHEGPSALNYTTVSFTGAAMLLLMFVSIYMPLKRNKLITRALYDSNAMLYQISKGAEPTITPEMVINEFHEAIEYPSPVGRGEALQMYSKFMTDLLGIIAPGSDPEKQALVSNQVRLLLDDLNSYADSSPHATAGIKDKYINADINIRAGVAYNVPEALSRGRAILEKDLAMYPTRIELAFLLIELGRATGDTALVDTWSKRVIELRPDLAQKLSGSISK